jgi:hypothetical protein
MVFAELRIVLRKTAHCKYHIKQGKPRRFGIFRNFAVSEAPPKVGLVNHWRDRMDMQKVLVDQR